jgi:hypothetical protein
MTLTFDVAMLPVLNMSLGQCAGTRVHNFSCLLCLHRALCRGGCIPQGGGQLQRRCYWLLEGDDDVVLVHYLMVDLHQNRPRPAPPAPGQQQMQV